MSGSVATDVEHPEQSIEVEVPAPTETAIEVEVPAPKQIAVVGYTESKKDAPWGDPAWERWLCNDLVRFCPNDWHRLYDVHAIKDIKADTQHDSFLKGNPRKLEDGSDSNEVALDGRPVYVMKADSDWPTAVTFPKDEVTEAFGDYFTNSISWMVAHAMLEIRGCAVLYAEANLAAMAEYAKGQGEGAASFCQQASVGLYDALVRDYEATCAIHIYGVDMAVSGEYGAQRPSCEHILGVAQGRGIQTYIPLSSDLLKITAMYGAENDSAMYAKFTERRDELMKRGRHLESVIGQQQTQLAQIQGALETTNYVIGVWCNPRGEREPEATTETTPEQLPEAA